MQVVLYYLLHDLSYMIHVHFTLSDTIHTIAYMMYYACICYTIHTCMFTRIVSNFAHVVVCCLCVRR